MTAQSIVCGTCAAEVPYGRLSCPSCGELLASVAGSRRVAGAIGTRTALPDVEYDAGSAPSATVVEGQLALESAVAGSAARDLDEELPWATSTTHGTGVAFDHGALGEPDDEDVDDPDGVEDRDAADEGSGHARGTNGSPPNGGPAWAGLGLTGSPTPAYMPRPGLGGPPAAAPAFAGPGAYVPPVPVTVVPAGPPAPARAWAGHGPDVVDRVDAAAPAVDTHGNAAAATSEQADRRARLAEFVGWLSVAGAAFSAVGFLLPWGLVVIGSNDVGYFGRWGIAGPWHVAVTVGVLIVLALALIKNDVPVWIRTGLAGLGLGALILGLVWPYLLWPPMGTGPGAVIAAIGATALTVSGMLALIADRHAEGQRPV
jgi:hypothetical protein